jgi:5-methylcytosine-specific restriction endonuclease McrA
VRDEDIAIQTPSKPVRVPQVIIATRFDRVPMHRPKFSKRTLYRLQRGRCWYSGKPMNLEDMNLDHVVPRSRGGKTDFENCRLVDPKINSQKGDRLPEEAGLKRGPVLQKPASIPAMAMIQNHSQMHHWGLFLPG